VTPRFTISDGHKNREKFPALEKERERAAKCRGSGSGKLERKK
jgi:hypothetical protein